MSSSEVKNILQKIVNTTRKDWALKLDKALWPYKITYKTPIGTPPYSIVYGKDFHLLVELEYQTYWPIKKLNIDPGLIGRK